MTTSTKDYDDHDNLIAYSNGASFSQSELPIPNFPCYVLSFDFCDDDDTVVIHARDDNAAIDFAKARYNGPFTVLERTVKFREVAEVAE